MSKHLLPETIEQLEQHQLKGETLVEVLLHLNSCPECQRKLPVPDKEEILKRLFADDDDDEGEQQPTDSAQFEEDQTEESQAEELNQKTNKTKNPSWFQKLKRIFK